MFRRKQNRFLVNFEGIGFVPVATNQDDVPVFETSEPVRIGDDAIIYAEGQRRMVRLLKSSGMVKNSLYLVDMGRA